MGCECERLKVCGTCVNYVPKHEGCLLNFMLHGEFETEYHTSDKCECWTPYWEQTMIEGGVHSE